MGQSVVWFFRNERIHVWQMLCRIEPSLVFSHINYINIIIVNVVVVSQMSVSYVSAFVWFEELLSVLIANFSDTKYISRFNDGWHAIRFFFLPIRKDWTEIHSELRDGHLYFSLVFEVIINYHQIQLYLTDLGNVYAFGWLGLFPLPAQMFWTLSFKWTGNFFKLISLFVLFRKKWKHSNISCRTDFFFWVFWSFLLWTLFLCFRSPMKTFMKFAFRCSWSIPSMS